MVCGFYHFDHEIGLVCTKNLNPDVVVMKPAKDRA
jgi:hypothetical protein